MNIGSLVERYPALALALAAGGGLLVFKYAQSRQVYPKLPPAATVDSQQAAIAWVSPEMLQSTNNTLRQQIEAKLAAQAQAQQQYYQQYQQQQQYQYQPSIYPGQQN